MKWAYYNEFDPKAAAWIRELIGAKLITDGFWSDAAQHQCRDGKARRIPSPQPGILGVADGLPAGLDLGWLESSFPLCEKIQGRAALLKGYGNAINPVLAAEFIRAAAEAIGSL